MYLTKRNPYNSRFFIDDFVNRSIADFVGSDFTVNQPAVNIVEKADSFIFEIAAPGLIKDDFNVSLDKNQLIISAEKKTENGDSEGKFTRKEFNFSSFKRSFTIPKAANKEEIKASYNNGILSVTLLKREEEIEKGAVEIEIK
jgi:HSP20 family protein